MTRIIAAINMTIDGFCDHTYGVADEEIHDHYTELLQRGDAILYGRITYELMKFWQPMVKVPSGEKSMDDFAKAIDKIPKIVFSNSLKETGWGSARLATRSLEEEVRALKEQSGKTIFAGSRSIILQLMQLNLIDEYQLCVHPVVAGSGLPLFENINDLTMLKLKKTKTFKVGAVTLYYEPVKK